METINKMATLEVAQAGELEMGYQGTVMYGRYTRNLAEYAREQAAEIRRLEKKRELEDKERSKELHTYRGKWTSRCVWLVSSLWRHSVAKIGEDWVFLALLGIIMAVISYALDYGVFILGSARRWVYADLAQHTAASYFAWISTSMFLIFVSVGVVNVVAPQAIGSGIPEMKTVLRGVVLKEYLTFRTGVAKVIALTAALGSGMPLGKEGPLVHIASIVATLMSKMVTSFKGIYENESRNSDMLAAACAVGVSVNFGAPIGGVLFSIEVTSVYFAIRNYWRGFFSAVFGALMYRLMAYWFNNTETLTAMYRTDFRADFSFNPHELFIFALIGAFGGLAGALFVLCHRKYVLFMRKNKTISSFLQKSRFIYPGLVSFFIATLYFPPGLGQYMLATMSTKQQILSMFSNYTWYNNPHLTEDEQKIVNLWTTEHGNLFVTLGVYMVTTFFFTILASTIPVPSGSLIPIFRMGAAFGRIVGEAMHHWFPDGVRIGDTTISPILPGGYAIVGAAAFSSGVTHSISICVMVAEMTGQIQHIISILVAVLVSNAISTLLQPSLYDSIILIKKLPYLPDILPSSNAAYNIHVEDFMNRNIKYIWNSMTFQELKATLKDNPKIRSFPLVDNPTKMVLLGSVQRRELINILKRHIGHERRLSIAMERFKEQSKQKATLETKDAADLETLIQERRPSVVSIKIADETDNKPAEKPATASTEQKPAKSPAPHGSLEKKPSRFSVTKTPEDALTSAPSTFNGQTIPSISITLADPPTPEEETPSSVPKKSILKKRNSFPLPPPSLLTLNLNAPAPAAPYSTVSGGEGSKVRQAIGAFIRKSSHVLDAERIHQFAHAIHLVPSSQHTLKIPPMSKVIDMTAEEQREWEEAEMRKPVNFQNCHVDPAPFQLVERTSLLKAHSMFSLLGVNRAYVTTIGRLVGIVSLKELRKAIEEVNAGVSLAFQRPRFNSQCEGSDFECLMDDASPGAPKDDVESGGNKQMKLDEAELLKDDNQVTVNGSLLPISDYRQRMKLNQTTVSTVWTTDSNGSTADLHPMNFVNDNTVTITVNGASPCSSFVTICEEDSQNPTEKSTQ